VRESEYGYIRDWPYGSLRDKLLEPFQALRFRVALVLLGMVSAEREAAQKTKGRKPSFTAVKGRVQ